MRIILKLRLPLSFILLLPFLHDTTWQQTRQRFYFLTIAVVTCPSPCSSIPQRYLLIVAKLAFSYYILRGAEHEAIDLTSLMTSHVHHWSISGVIGCYKQCCSGSDDTPPRLRSTRLRRLLGPKILCCRVPASTVRRVLHVRTFFSHSRLTNS